MARAQRFEGTVSLDHRCEPRHRPRDRAAHRRRGRLGRHHRPQAGGPGCRASRRSATPATAVAGRADDADHRAAVFAHIAERHGRLDHLVNNAGINPVYGPVVDVDPAAARKILEVNVIAALEWTRDAVAAGLLALDRQHLLDLRPRREPGHRVLRRLQGGADQPDRAARARAGARHPRQRRRPGRHQDGVRPRALRGARGGGVRRVSAARDWASRTTSPVPSPSCSRTTPAWITGQTLSDRRRRRHPSPLTAAGSGEG